MQMTETWNGDSETTFIRSEGVLLREIGGELLLLNSTSDNYFGLNPSGAAMFQSLADGATFGATVAAVAEEFDAPVDVITTDLEKLLGELLDRGLLTVQR